MDESDLTIEEYIELHAEKAQRHADFPAIVYNDALTSNQSISSEPTIWMDYHLELRGIYGLEEMGQGLTDRLRMVYTRTEGQVLFTSHAWRRLFEIRELLVHEFILEFFYTCRMSDTEMRLDVRDTLCFHLGGARDFLGIAPYYTFIRDPIRRLCHRLISFSISDRAQTPEKVAPGPEREETVATGAPEIVEGAHTDVEGDQAVPTPVQAPQLPPAATQSRTMPQRMVRLEEEVYGIREILDEQRKVLDTMVRDFSRFNVWAARGISQLLDTTEATYMRYSKTHVPYQRRRIRRRTDDASTSAAPYTADQPDL
ncbi:hypothetical protein Tco_0564750 [Tanacetum coccineum]